MGIFSAIGSGIAKVSNAVWKVPAAPVKAIWNSGLTGKVILGGGATALAVGTGAAITGRAAAADEKMMRNSGVDQAAAQNMAELQQVQAMEAQVNQLEVMATQAPRAHMPASPAGVSAMEHMGSIGPAQQQQLG